MHKPHASNASFLNASHAQAPAGAAAGAAEQEPWLISACCVANTAAYCAATLQDWGENVSSLQLQAARAATERRRRHRHQPRGGGGEEAAAAADSAGDPMEEASGQTRLYGVRC